MFQTTISFPQCINRTTGKTRVSELNKSINECLGILFRTRIGEMLGDPEYGCMLIERIFMYNGVIIPEMLKEDMIHAVEKYEPRIIMNNADIKIEQDYQIVRIYVRYIIKENGQINSYNFSVTPDDNPYK